MIDTMIKDDYISICKSDDEIIHCGLLYIFSMHSFHHRSSHCTYIIHLHIISIYIQLKMHSFGSKLYSAFGIENIWSYYLHLWLGFSHHPIWIFRFRWRPIYYYYYYWNRSHKLWYIPSIHTWLGQNEILIFKMINENKTIKNPTRMWYAFIFIYFSHKWWYAKSLLSFVLHRWWYEAKGNQLRMLIFCTFWQFLIDFLPREWNVCNVI